MTPRTERRQRRADCQHPDAVAVRGYPKYINDPPLEPYILNRWRCPDCGLRWDRSAR